VSRVLSLQTAAERSRATVNIGSAAPNPGPIRRGRLDSGAVVLPRTSEPGARIDNCRRLITVDQIVPGGFSNERPDRVLGFDDDIGDHIGPFSVDALNGGQRQVLPQVYAGDLRWHQRSLARQANMESAQPERWTDEFQGPKDVPEERLLKPLIGRCCEGHEWPSQPVWVMRRDDEPVPVVVCHVRPKEVSPHKERSRIAWSTHSVATISRCDESCRPGREIRRTRSTARLMAAYGWSPNVLSRVTSPPFSSTVTVHTTPSQCRLDFARRNSSEAFRTRPVSRTCDKAAKRRYSA